MILWHSVFFYLFALVACGLAAAVVFSSNIVRMALYLVLSLGATAGLFFLAGADFVGSMQLLIYVGGTLVLLVFGVMLTAQGPFVSMRTSAGDWVLTVVVGGALLGVLLQSTLMVAAWRAPIRPAAPAGTTATTPRAGDSPATSDPTTVEPTATPIGMALLGLRVDRLADGSTTTVLSGYLLPFELLSIHLLVVLIGAAYLARTKRRAAAAKLSLQQ